VIHPEEFFLKEIESDFESINPHPERRVRSERGFMLLPFLATCCFPSPWMGEGRVRVIITPWEPRGEVSVNCHPLQSMLYSDHIIDWIGEFT